MSLHFAHAYRFLIVSGLCVFLCLCAVGASAAEKISPEKRSEEKRKIEHLIDFIAECDYDFIRNGRKYSSDRAAAHMRMKVMKAGDRLKTARQFIDYIASRSSFSGRPYYVRDKNGKQTPSASWLRAELLRYENQYAKGDERTALVVGRKIVAIR